MAVTLPTLPTPWSAQPRLSDFSARLTPPLGGAAQKVARLGSRYTVTLEIPPLDDDCADQLLGALLEARATGATVIARWPQPRRLPFLGVPLVNGGSQTGTTLNVDGLTTRNIGPGRFFSVTVSGRSYLYATTRAAVATAAGAAALTISPMLRASPADNAALEFNNPVIEGWVEGDAEQWSIDMLTATTGFQLTIAEAE